jgi:hypothetical protein
VGDRSDEGGGSNDGFNVGEGGSGGSSSIASPSPNLWHGGVANGAFKAFLAAMRATPASGAGPWGSVPGTPRAMGSHAAAPTLYDSALPTSNGSAPTPSHGVVSNDNLFIFNYTLTYYKIYCYK